MCSPKILAQQVRDHSWPVRPNICARGALSWWGCIHESFYSIFKHPVNQLTENYFKHRKKKNFTNEGCLCCQGQFSNTSQLRKSQTFPAGQESLELVQKPTEKLSACSALKGTSQHLNKVIRENSCVYLFVFPYFLPFMWDWLGSQLVYFWNNLFHFSKPSSSCRRWEALLQVANFIPITAW